ncbi:vWA domain-containing protein [Tabrizicola oligotrophica]|uniref:VWA domain-containing protein n=1 Tax=Tabrizicola oligotrophica TaxID=2710650 RepID=A0A6M0QYN3_9RHOB|nr:vWA domain-containing protein [Tabrizicola oligotrophica]NEY91592.1 VWA domain-containing protein [Tabrizicola oligotrophica]
MAAQLPSAIAAFRKAEDGALIIFALFLFVLMATMGGVAIDIMRYETTRTELSQTLDRCTLMAASLDQQLDPESVVNDCVAKAGLADKLQNVVVLDGLSSRDVQAIARADSEPFFMHMIGIDHFDAVARSRAVQTVTNVEIMLVLDVSGSMSGAKIANLRSAASNFVHRMLSTDTNNRVSIGIVPYNAQVNLGAALRGKFNATDLHNVSDVNCLELPPAAFASPALSRTLALPMMAYSDHYYGTNTGSYYTSTSDAAARPNFSNNYCRRAANNTVYMPSQNETALQARINGLTAGGNTSIVLGMKWGTALLDPSARSIYDEFIDAGQMGAGLAGRPFDYTDTETLKVVVLMTDGEHVAHDRINDGYKSGLSPIYRSSGDGMYSIYHASRAGTAKFYVPHLNTWRSTAWTNNATPAVQQDWRAIWANLKLSYVAWQFYGRALGSSAYSAALNEMRSVYASVGTMDSQLQTTCTQAKNAGVVVYGIAFEAPTNGRTQISRCASTPQHFYAAQGAEIGTAFDSIASNLSMLKLTQ